MKNENNGKIQLYDIKARPRKTLLGFYIG